MEELDLKELISIFWNRKAEIIIITLIFMILGAIYSIAVVKPKYKASTTLVLTAVNETTGTKNTSEAITQTDLTLNSKLISTYSELIKSKTVLREVIDNLNIKDLDEEQLKNDIKVTAVSDTELIEISVVSKNPAYCNIIANEIAKVFTNQVSAIYNINNVHIVDKAEAPDDPYNINHPKNIVIFALIGLIVSVVVVLLIDMLDNTVKTEQDVEKATGLLVLAQIPEFNTRKSHRKGGRR